jgi:hypothetical protein
MKEMRIAAVAVLLAYGPAVFGQAMGMGMGALPAFSELDADDDGKVSKEELGAAIPERGVTRVFANFDKDEDGFLSKEEFDARAQARQ